MIRKILPFIIILMFTSCGYTPIYNKLDKTNYKINIIEINGERFVNNLISSEIKRISNSESDIIFNLKIDNDYKKIILSKNIKGTVSDYQLILKSDFIIEKDGNIGTISFTEKQNIKNTSDIFEQKNYENTIQRNFVISLIRKLNLELLSKQ